jgi:hypothetical protein
MRHCVLSVSESYSVSHDISSFYGILEVYRYVLKSKSQDLIMNQFHPAHLFS